MRLFIGVPVPIKLAETLLRVARSPEFAKARWTEPEKFHLTLVFLGEVSETRVSCIEYELAQIHMAPFEISFANLNIFPRAGILFVEIARSPRLLRLQSTVEDRMAGCGCAGDSRPYCPHITLARLRAAVRISKAGLALPAFVHQRFRVEVINLYRSHLTAAGSTYEVIAQKKFGSVEAL